MAEVPPGAQLLNAVAIVATDDAQAILDENRRRVRDMLDKWALWKMSTRSGPRQSSIAAIGQQLTETGGAKPGQIAVRETRSFRSSIPQGVDPGRLILLTERALLDGDAAGLARQMAVVRHCHYHGARSEAQRERLAVKSLAATIGAVYHVRTLRTFRQIGEGWLMAKLL